MSFTSVPDLGSAVTESGDIRIFVSFNRLPDGSQTVQVLRSSDRYQDEPLDLEATGDPLVFVVNDNLLEVGLINLIYKVRVLEGATVIMEETRSLELDTGGRPVVNFTLSTPSSGLVPLEMTFVNQTLGGVDYVWDFGDGFGSDDTDPVHTYVEPGNYDVTLTATNEAGESFLTKAGYILARDGRRGHDPYWSQSVLQLTADNAATNTTFINEADFTPITRLGSPVIDTVDFLTGNGSVSFPGGDGNALRLDTLGAESPLYLRGNSFTIRFDYKMVTGDGYIFVYAGGYLYSWPDLSIRATSSGGVCNFNLAIRSTATGSGSPPDVAYFVNVGSMPLGQYNELQISRNGNLYEFFVNKVRTWSLTNSSPIRSTPNSAGLALGGSGYSDAGFPKECVPGWIDNVRIINGSFVDPNEKIYVDKFAHLVTIKYAFEGLNNATTGNNDLVDRIGIAFFGTAKLSITQKRYGDTSGYYDGNAWICPAGGNTALTAFGTGDYCLELSVRPSDSGTARVIAANRSLAANGWFLYKDANDNYCFENKTSSGTITVKGKYLAAWAPWDDIVAERKSGILYLYVNRRLVDCVIDASDMVASSYDMITGCLHTGTGMAFWYGYMDALRLTKAARTLNADKPIAAFTTGSSLSGTMPLVVNFSNASINAVSYLWDFGDGQTSTLANPAHTFEIGGLFDVSLTVTDSHGNTNTYLRVDFVMVRDSRLGDDPYWAQTALQLTADNAANSTTFLNEATWSNLAVTGNPVIDTSDFVSGDGSVKFPGGEGNALKAPIAYAAHPLNMNGNDFTIRFDLKNLSTSLLYGNSGYALNFGGGYNLAWTEMSIAAVVDGSTAKLLIAIRSVEGSGSPDIVSFEQISGLPYHVFSEVQLSRRGSLFELYFDKILVWSKTDSRAIKPLSGSNGLGIGGSFSSDINAPRECMQGNIDNLKIINGVFVPATETLFVDKHAALVTCKYSFEGPDNSTTGVNEFAGNIPVSFFGTAKLVTSQKRFGGSSAYFDGGAWMCPIYDTVDNTAFGTGDYCIEISVRSGDTGTARVIASNRAQSENGWTLYKDSNENYCFISQTENNTIILSGKYPTAIAPWDDISVDRVNGVVYLFVNKKLVDFKVDTSNMLAAVNRVLIIGWQHTGAGIAPWIGHMDALRITKASRTLNSSKPVAAFELTSSDSGDIPFQAVFANRSVHGLTYLWNFGDGATSTLVNPTHMYTTAGTFTVSLTATNASGSTTFTKTNLVSVSSATEIIPCIWDPVIKGGDIVLSNSNKTATLTFNEAARGTTLRNAGVSYAEIRYGNHGGGQTLYAGILVGVSTFTGAFMGPGLRYMFYDGSNSVETIGGATPSQTTAPAHTFVTGDVLGIVTHHATGVIDLYVNNVFHLSATCTPAANMPVTLVGGAPSTGGNAVDLILACSAADQTYAPPAGATRWDELPAYQLKCVWDATTKGSLVTLSESNHRANIYYTQGVKGTTYRYSGKSMFELVRVSQTGTAQTTYIGLLSGINGFNGEYPYGKAHWAYYPPGGIIGQSGNSVVSGSFVDIGDGGSVGDIYVIETDHGLGTISVTCNGVLLGTKVCTPLIGVPVTPFAFAPSSASDSIDFRLNTSYLTLENAPSPGYKAWDNDLVESQPLAVFTAVGSTAGDVPFTVVFSSAGTQNAKNYFWDFGDGRYSQEANPTHTYYLTGTYAVSLVVDNISGDSTETKEAYVTITGTDIEVLGGTITQVGEYVVHTFLGTEKFVLATALPFPVAEILVVPGAGTGGGYAGSGGAGGALVIPSLITAVGEFDVIVGNGGIPTGSFSAPVPHNGEDSSFDGIAAIGGGHGGAGGLADTTTPSEPGGGGCSSSGSSRYLGKAGISGQTGRGGNTGPSGPYNSGGGGGGGGDGADTNTSGPPTGLGHGGIGLLSSISGVSKRYGGGGGGSSTSSGPRANGGAGGGGKGGLINVGNGFATVAAENGVDGTGGGGGGGATEVGGIGGMTSGGKGCVIVRYRKPPVGFVGCTLDPAVKGGSVIVSNGNKTASVNSGQSIRCTTRKNAGISYVEVRVDEQYAPQQLCVGLLTGFGTFTGGFFSPGQRYMFVSYNNTVSAYDGGTTVMSSSTAHTWVVGDVLGIATDHTAGIVYLYINNVFHASFTAALLIGVPSTVVIEANSSSGQSWVGTIACNADEQIYIPPEGAARWDELPNA